MSLFANQLKSAQILQNAFPFTFTIGELETMKVKFQAGVARANLHPKHMALLNLPKSEINSLLRMIEMTYLQGLSGSGVLPSLQTPAAAAIKIGQPPANYVCVKCGLQGHYSEQCPVILNTAVAQQLVQQQNHNIIGGNVAESLRNSNSAQHTRRTYNSAIANSMKIAAANVNQMQMIGFQNKPPPANYICHKCNIAGHWRLQCPKNDNVDYGQPPPANYVCHRCGSSGHWIRSCPTNGNPAFDHKPHLKDSQVSSTLPVLSQPPNKIRRLNQM